MVRDIKEFERSGYDKWADGYDSTVWVRWALTWADRFSEHIPYGGVMLDVGCGTGDVLLSLLGKRPSLMHEK